MGKKNDFFCNLLIPKRIYIKLANYTFNLKAVCFFFPDLFPNGFMAILCVLLAVSNKTHWEMAGNKLARELN